MSDRAARIGTMIVLGFFAAMAIAAGCAHQPKGPPPLWDICRDSCASRGAVAAAVIGPVDPTQKPNCACGMKDEGT